ncbi:MAG: CDP-alcohol phosphatidyltransferase family protein [Coriobacteriia bacterium]|nr:CDP-alcohol phosphatidyltransferase family protein [Coriobacteriia bacterium]
MVAPLSAPYYVVYAYCIVSDLVDGIIARKLNVVSTQGSMLDTYGDFAFVIVILITMFRCFNMPTWLIVWISVIAVVKIASGIVSVIRHSGVVAHTYLDKVSGLLIVLIIPIVQFSVIGLGIPAAIACVVASVTAIEDTAIAFSKRKVTSSTLTFFKLEE